MSLQYRDLVLPSPKWVEQGIYGGYRWLELKGNPDCWVNRKWEPYLQIWEDIMEEGNSYNCKLGCLKQFKDILTESRYIAPASESSTALFVIGSRKFITDLIKPSSTQKDDVWKLQRIIQKTTLIGIVGEVNLNFDIKAINPNITILSDDANIADKLVSRREIMTYSDRIKIIIDETLIEHKTHVLNWSNIITWEGRNII